MTGRGEAPALRSVDGAIAELRRRGLGPAGVADPLAVADGGGWLPATALLDGSRLAALLEYPTERWGAAPHASATLAWKAYTYWLAHLVLLGWARRSLPRLSAENTLFRLSDQQPYVTVGLRTTSVAGRTGREAELLGELREELLEHHLAPLAEAIRQRTGVSGRVLWGEVAAGFGRVAARTRTADGEPTDQDLLALLRALGIDHLVELRSGQGPLSVRRRTCCLQFTVPGLNGPCTDCLVPPSPRPPVSSQQEKNR